MTTGSEFPDRPLFLDALSGETVSYADLLHHLKQDTIEFRPCLQPATTGEAIIATLTALVLGHELTLIDSDLSASEVAEMGLSSAAKEQPLHISGLSRESTDQLQAIRTANARFRLTLHTSGSTGLPKCVRHTLKSLTRTLKISDSQSTSIWGMAYNPTHIAGIQVILQAFFNANPLVLLHGAPPGLARKCITSHAITHLAGTPSFFRLLLPTEAPFPGVRSVALGGEPATTQLIEMLRVTFPQARIRNLYGSTEAGTLLAAEGDSFRIADESAHLIRIRDNQLEIHQSALGDLIGTDPLPDGWYSTGDSVAANADGSFRILSRTADWINVGGHKVNPAEVEAALLSHPEVREALVYPLNNSVLGQIPAAKVVLLKNSTVDEATLRAHLAKHLQTPKIPRKFSFVETLPRSTTGKIQRQA